MENYIINLLGNIGELFVLLFFFTNFTPKLKKSTTIVLSIVCMLLQFVSTNLFLAKSNLIILGTIIFCFLISLLFEVKWINRILYTLFLYLILAIPEAIIGMTLSLLFKVNISILQSTPVMFTTCTLLSKFLSYIFVMVFSKHKLSVKKAPSKRNILLIYSLPISSVMIMLLFLRCCYTISDLSFQIITLVASIILMFANIAIFYMLDKLNELIETKEKLLFAEKHINNQVVHYQGLYNHQNELRIFKHDIKNRFSALIGFLKNNEVEKALQTMENNLDWINQKNSNIVNSGNPVVDAIIQSKLISATEKGVQTDVYIKLSENIEVDEIELGIIIGNALDNAIEAVQTIPQNENKNVELKMISAANRISICIKNPVKENIDTTNLITTKPDKVKHGYGIKSIQTLSQKYDGIVLFDCKNKIFTININLCNHSVSNNPAL